MDDTTVTPCTSVIVIDDVQQLKVGCNFLAGCTACNCGASCYLVGLVSVIWRTPTRTTIANQRRGTNTVQM